MSLPVSQYEALLAEVRGLRRKAQRVQQLATPLISNCSSPDPKVPPFRHQDDEVNSSSSYYYYKMEPPLLAGRQHNASSSINRNAAASSSIDGDTTCSEDEYIVGGGVGGGTTHLSVSSEPITHRDRTHLSPSVLYHGTWPVERTTMWNSEPTAATDVAAPMHHAQLQEVSSVMSFASSSGVGVALPLDRMLAACGSPTGTSTASRRSSQQQLEAKVDMVYSLLAMLSGQEHADMGETLLALSANPESCSAMRQSGCVPLLVQMLHSDGEADARSKAARALHNLVHAQPDEKMRKREVRVLRLLEQARGYADAVRAGCEEGMLAAVEGTEDDDRHPVQTVAHLMKLSFDELHRHAICILGGIHTIANLVEAEHVNHGSTTDETHCILMRRYACMALTNLTFGDSGNKALLCSFREFMRALVVQLQSPSDELRQVTASVLRNLSWRADSSSKDILREVGSVTGLMKAAMTDNKENTLKSILSALWNLSAHCTENKSEICSVEGALGFLVDMLTYKTPSKSLAIIENSGGILRNISSQIAVRDDYREVLRRHNCLQILLEQLKSPSLTIVSNACGTLWNLSAKCPVDQETLWQMGAPSMLRSLNHSKHKMIAMGSSAALKNLISARPSQQLAPTMDSTALAMDLPVLPTLGARKQKALLQDLDQTLSETYENIEKDSPVKVATSTRNNHEFVQKNHKNKYNSKRTNEASPTSLNCSSEPSTSYDSRYNLSLPGEESEVVKRCFLKTRCTDSGLQSLDSEGCQRGGGVNSSSCNSLDNDRCKKLKEVSVYSDEKDHCSIEDASDSDNQSSFGLERRLLVNEESNCTTVSTPSLPLPKYGNLGNSNITMFEGDIDEIEMEDISIHFGSDSERRMDKEESTEKRDVEKENYTDFIGIRSESWRQTESRSSKSPARVPGSGIPLPRSSPRPIPTTSTNQPSNHRDSSDSVDGIDRSDIALGNNSETSEQRKTTTTTTAKLTSNLPRLSLQTSTPIKISIRSQEKEDEDVQVHDDIDEPVSLTVGQQMQDVEEIRQEIECSLHLDLDTSPTSNSTVATTSTSAILDMEPKPTESGSDRCFSSCVNFSLKDRLLERSCEESNPMDNRMLDPDAMIESLDRFTAELVSQASHLQQSKDEDRFKDNTWNEDTSPNEVTFPSLSSNAPNVVTFEDSSSVPVEEEVLEKRSNDFSSMNTNTMTESTLIAIEATKMATVFKNEAEMSHSMSSVASLESDKIPSASPKKRRSLPRSLMVKRALSNSLNNASSVESLSNLDQMNPPSAMAEVLDMEGSITSVASLPSENVQEVVKITDFVIDGAVNRNNSLLNTGKPGNMMNLLNNSHLNSVSDLDNINPPSLLNEITDLCNSLADVATEAIGSETELFEDCCTHVEVDEVTEFSDANSATPIQSDEVASSSPEISPKKTDKVRERRSAARDRYRTYTVEPPSTSEDYRTVSNEFRSVAEEEEGAIDESPTYNVKSTKLTPKERRQKDRARFETRVVEEAVTEVFRQPVIESTSSTRSSIRRNFMQKRLENRDRFRTQTLPDFSQTDIHLLVQKEADLVVKSLKNVPNVDELLDCETLSLVSNDDDSEVNSSSPVNYRTYHRSWGMKRNIPVIEPTATTSKPKIVKPSVEVVEDEEEGKGIRGRRKPLYSKMAATKTAKPVRNVVVKNAASSIRSKPAPKATKAKVERQGTFVKDEATKSRIPTAGSATKAKPAPPSRIPSKGSGGIPKGVNSERGRRVVGGLGRSTSADSRVEARRLQGSVSSQSLKAKRSSIPQATAQSVGGASAKKQVTSKIASLWKKIEESKSKQTAKKDTRVWIEQGGGEGGGLVRSNTFDNKEGVTLRGRRQEENPEKRVSRLGSFIVMDDTEDGARLQEIINAGATE